MEERRPRLAQPAKLHLGSSLHAAVEIDASSAGVSTKAVYRCGVYLTSRHGESSDNVTINIFFFANLPFFSCIIIFFYKNVVHSNEPDWWERYGNPRMLPGA